MSEIGTEILEVKDVTSESSQKLETQPGSSVNTNSFTIVLCFLVVGLFIFNLYKFSTITQQMAEMNQQIDSLNTQLKQEQVDNSLPKAEPAIINLAEPESGYSYAHTINGTDFLVSLKGVSTHINGGYKASIDIGNLNSARYGGFKIIYKWGVLDAQLHEVALTNELQPGSWNTIDLYLCAPPDPKETLVRIYIETDNLSLRTN